MRDRRITPLIVCLLSGWMAGLLLSACAASLRLPPPPEAAASPLAAVTPITASTDGPPTGSGAASPTPPPTATFTPLPGAALHVDAGAGLAPISPYIYGLNRSDRSGDLDDFMREIDLPVRRRGGNLSSRYNWQNDLSNHGVDWFFINSKRSDATGLPDDSDANRFIDANRRLEVDSFLVLPMLGWVANDLPGACGFSLRKYGPQQADAAGDGNPDCGNGRNLSGTPISANDPLDTSLPAGPEFTAGWVQYLVGRYGPADAGGVRFYNLDNEPDLWSSTHRDVFPVAMTASQFIERTSAYAAAIKAADPSAQIAAPGLGVYSYYFVSPYDGQRQDWSDPDDTRAHGDLPFIAWYLEQLHAYEQQHGLRLVDYLDLHFYPQAGEALAPAGDADLQALRLRSTRALWDPDYIDESWIAEQQTDRRAVRLIPRMRQWIEQHAPGLGIAIGEYNWGGLEHLNGALAQAEVLGIYGREGVALAALWQPLTPDLPWAYAFRIYRNYDGNGARFGDLRVDAVSDDPDRLSIFAARRTTDGALTLVVINKSSAALERDIVLSGFTPGPAAQVYRYDAADLHAIRRLDDQPATPAGLRLEFPPASITLLALPAAE